MTLNRHRLRLFLTACLVAWSTNLAADCVIFLHGLARTARSMSTIATAFEDAGFTVANIDYPSREKPIEELAPLAVDAGLTRCAESDNGSVHFVTHSMGGILVRHYLAHQSIEDLGRVVMLAPPNHGSEVVDTLGEMPGFSWLNGPAGGQLGTDAKSMPAQLGPVDYPVGIIAGNRTFNPLLSQFLPNPDDGKVSVASAKLEGMSAFKVIPASHPFIMSDDQAIANALAFIRTGAFVD